MFDGLLTSLGELMGSPWIYPLIAAISLVDAVVPIFPSEAPLIMAGVYAGSTGSPNLLLILLAAGAGAMAGDHLAYLIGRSAAGRIEAIPADSRRGRAIGGAKRLLETRGGMALVIGRFIPWGRIATTIVFGAMRYPRARFTMFDAIGVSAWALHGTLMGYIGGHAFEQDPLKGLALGLGLAILASALIELVRWLIARRRGSGRVEAAAEAGSHDEADEDADDTTDGAVRETAHDAADEPDQDRLNARG
ncbi:DedA family protein [Calidifontibacter indicus]|uniref:DedA family protein n=1 Tax=Calidifontibacter indicus TaxID=419650 RepID=UPI003D75197C